MNKQDLLNLKNIVIDSLENLKTKNIVSIDVSNKSGFTDCLLIGTGTSSTHIKAISNEVVENIKNNGLGNFIKGVESDNEWVLIDLYDIVVNVMLQDTREFYSLEKLWSVENSIRAEKNTA